jgi:hypothetical protein
MNRYFRNGFTGIFTVGSLFALQACTDVSSHAKNPSYEKTKISSHVNEEIIRKGSALLKDGDLVLRTGNDFISLVLRRFSRVNKTYSHCGIVRKKNGKFFVYNAIGGEDNPDAKLRRESFEQFCDPAHNLGFGIFRYHLKEKELKRLDSIVDLFYNKKIPFDLKFNLQTDSSFYCAEFVYKALNLATGKPHYLPVSYIADFKYVAIDNLFLNKHTKKIYSAVFQ